MRTKSCASTASINSRCCMANFSGESIGGGKPFLLVDKFAKTHLNIESVMGYLMAHKVLNECGIHL